MHSHRCPNCGTIWKHDPATIPPGKLEAAHTCPVEGCGGYDSWKKSADEVEAPGFCHNGARTIVLTSEAA